MASARKPRGRRGKLTPEVREKIVSAIRAGNYAQVAAEYAGISRSTFFRWLDRGRQAQRGLYRDLFEAVEAAEREAEVRAVAILQKHMDESWQAAMAFLERKHPERWGRRDQLKVEMNPREILSELLSLTPDELDEAVDLAADPP